MVAATKFWQKTTVASITTNTNVMAAFLMLRDAKKHTALLKVATGHIIQGAIAHGIISNFSKRIAWYVNRLKEVQKLFVLPPAVRALFSARVIAVCIT